jgi:hypothetical protein
MVMSGFSFVSMSWFAKELPVFGSMHSLKSMQGFGVSRYMGGGQSLRL